MIISHPQVFVSLALILSFWNIFEIFSFIFSDFNLQMLLLVQSSYTYMIGKRKKMEFSVGLN